MPACVLTAMLYGVRSNIPAFQHSLADISRWGWGMWALELVAVSAALTSIGGLVHVPKVLCAAVDPTVMIMSGRQFMHTPATRP